ncbi:phosphoglycerol transferase MdoB-like AlkP superfamily enzyme [Lachnotalea glycerini]|uniref:Phosphoglycerol transferase MdoB-like AlkP superfamily enzyme n=1 Tax=Lachnotalea glycerini TaxID=1763509 RepID=A0A318ESC5_9FIRM|nr:sulfatase-like hydrolase/transferase [Lachnotalea glycerini]PXV91467.1 phosphoglycerol transferase MdoB-like AlkP superfamily enzyme [Lachnotalea glycerini]
MKEISNRIKEIITKENIKKFSKYLTLVIVAIYLMLFVFGHKCYITFAENGMMNKDTLLNAVLVIGATVLTVVLLLIKNNLSDRMNMFVSYALFFVSPVICYYAFEYFQKSIYTITVLSIRKRYLFFNFVILSVILLTIYIITNSTKVAVIGLTLIINLFGVINYYVYSFRGVALVAADVFSIQTASNVVEGYKLFIDTHIYYIFIITVFIISLACKLRSFKALPVWKLRIPAIICYIIYTSVFFYVFVFSNQLSNWNINVKLYRPHEGYRKYGTFLSTVRTMGYIIVEKPEGYSVKQIEDIADSYSLSSSAGQTPNIIVIMDEAFSDLETVSEFPISEDYMPFIHSLQENTIKGNAYVSVFGGNTANSEFEFLTGNSMGLLPANSVPYQLFIKKQFPSIVYSLKQQNYVGNIGMHPFKSNGFNRLTVYPLLGFEQFITIEKFQNADKLRDKVTDEANFNKIIEMYEESKSQSDNPFFLFNVTMQNHGGFITTDPNFVQKIKIEDEYYYDEGAQNYLSLIKYTDEAVEKLIKYFENVEEPTVVIFFGDHQPGLSQTWYDKILGKSEKDLTTQELMEKYKVPFFAWANYDIQEETVDKISMNYLSAYIMNKLGINLTKYQQFLLDVHEQVPVMNSIGYWGVDGGFYDYSDTTSPYYEIINQYRCVQYNNMHDKGKRVDSMFYMN